MERFTDVYFAWLIQQALAALEGCGDQEREAALAWLDGLRARAQRAA